MARRKKTDLRRSRVYKTGSYPTLVGRDNILIARLKSLPRTLQKNIRVPFSAVEDNRLHVPYPDFRRSRPRRTDGRPASSRVNQYAPLHLAKMQFISPERVITCVRRQMRKEVIFALNKSGRNGGRKYRRNSLSDVSC